MEAILSFIPSPIAYALMAVGFVAMVIGGVRLGYKSSVKGLAYKLVCEAEERYKNLSGQGAKKKAEVFEALRSALPTPLKIFITDEVLDSVIETAVKLMKQVLASKEG